MSELKFEPFQKVLVRDSDDMKWKCSLFSYYEEKDELYFCCGIPWEMCLPYEGNEHLLGTTDSPTPPEPEFKFGDHVEVRDDETSSWRKAVFLSVSKGSYYCVIEPAGACLWKFCRHADW